MSILSGTVMPHNLDAEQSVLGSMLIEKEAIAKAMEFLKDEDFYGEPHKVIYRAMVSLFDDGQAVDLITVAERLKQMNSLEDVGGVQYISTLANIVPTAANIEHYAHIVEEKSILRKLISAATNIVRWGYDARDEVATILDKSEQSIFEIGMGRSTQGYSVLKNVLIDALERIEYLYAHKGSAIGVSSGLSDLDQLTAGFQKSDLIILAARPSVGKSSFALSIARGAAVLHKVPVGVFSLEMSKEQLAMRLLCAEAGIDGQRLRTGYLQDEVDWKRLSNALGVLGEAPIYIDDTPNMGLMELRAKARRMKAEHDVGMLVIDYMQLMHMGGRVENRQQEISAISRSLKALARELECPILALSQLSRQVEQREGKKPQLSDLRECLTGDSLVALASGEALPIKDLVGTKPQVMTVVDSKIAPAEASRVWKVGERPVFQLTTRIGRTICATENHPFLKANGWTSLCDLQVGDQIALPGAASALAWDAVLSIEARGSEDVYDMEVPGTHCFVANGIVVHNSGAIEQDADVVMFLHCPDEANQDLMEVILAKQRNGPTGIVRLLFQKNIGRFEQVTDRPE